MSAGFMKLGAVVKAQHNVVAQLDANIKHLSNGVDALLKEGDAVQAQLEAVREKLRVQRSELDNQTALRNSLRETLENFNA